jgi:diguanylate cyclase (GGDEF)-like protein
MDSDDAVFANSDDAMFANEEDNTVQDDLREKIAGRLTAQFDQIAADTVAVFPYCGAETLAPDYCRRLGDILVQLLAFAVRDGRLDPRGEFVEDLHNVILERTISMDRLATFAYLTERTALDELALDETIGATSEPWPLVAQLVRRASFDLLGAYGQRARLQSSDLAIIDPLTKLYTRPLFDAVLAKEVVRAGRVGYPISLILFDVDHLADINSNHGRGVGDRILERLGFLIRSFFRQHDWVARHSDDAIAVLLPHTVADNATELAQRVVRTVETRLRTVDHRNDTPVAVTLSAAVVNVTVEVGDVIDPERYLADAEAAVERAKQQGRNRVVRMDSLSQSAKTRASAT